MPAGLCGAGSAPAQARVSLEHQLAQQYAELFFFDRGGAQGVGWQVGETQISDGPFPGGTSDLSVVERTEVRSPDEIRDCCL